MDCCTLRPPNDRYLSDDIIGSVLEGRRSNRHFLNFKVKADEDMRPSRQSYPQSLPLQSSQVDKIKATSRTPDKDAAAVLGLLSLINETKRKRVQPPDVASRKRIAISSEARALQAETDTESTNSDQDPVIVNLSMGREKRRQTICRDAQDQRKRQQDEHLINLKENQHLKQGIAKYEQRRRSMCATFSSNLDGWNMVHLYFQVLQFGLRLNSQRFSNFEPGSTYLDLLRTMMAPDVVFNSGQGVEAMIRGWECVSRWFQDVEYKLVDLERSALGCLVATTTMNVTITEQTVRNVFPHLCAHNDEGARLANKLLGQHISMRGLTRFDFDSSIGRFTRVFASSDLMTPMLCLFGSIKDVSQVFDRSAISPDFQWRSMV